MRKRSLCLLALVVAVLAATCSSALADTWYTLSNPIQPDQFTSLPFGARSQWLQPWRSELVTRPASALTGAIGMNFNVTPSEAYDTAELLHDSGFSRVRLEIGWNNMSYANPSQLANPTAIQTYIEAFKQFGLRPLILLNANSEGPGPSESVSLNLTAAAAEGATTIDLDSASAAQVVPGLTGIDLDEGGAWLDPAVFITSVDANGVATLSEPLPQALPAGATGATTLRYGPFSPPYLSDGVTPNPRFTQTMAGWLQYVQGVCDFVKQVYGSDNFDVEVWNELTFGSQFLDESNYYNPVPDPTATGDVDAAMLTGTINFLANPANGLTDVKVGDGFANQVPWVTGSNVPAGTAAIDHHPYENYINFPSGQIINGDEPVDAMGNPEFTQNPNGSFQDTFIPSYTAFFPEYYLTGIQTETLMRQLSPILTNIYGYPYGAETHPAGSPPPANWITEDNLDSDQAQSLGLPASDVGEFEAKAMMRFYAAYSSLGMQAIDLYAAQGTGMIPQSFFDAVDANPSAYPGDAAGGPAMAAVGRMAQSMAGTQPISSPRQLTLNAIASDNDTDVQFTGNGTAAEPSLYNRDVLTFFPFQVNSYKFVSAVYVMTRDLAEYYTSTPAPGLTSYDLPPENFRLTIGNVNGATAEASLTDPLTGTMQPVSIVSRQAHQIVVQLQATDSPRMLTVDDDPNNPAFPVTASSSSSSSSSASPASSPSAGDAGSTTAGSSDAGAASAPEPAAASTTTGSTPGAAAAASFAGASSSAASPSAARAASAAARPRATVRTARTAARHVSHRRPARRSRHAGDRHEKLGR